MKVSSRLCKRFAVEGAIDLSTIGNSVELEKFPEPSIQWHLPDCGISVQLPGKGSSTDFGLREIFTCPTVLPFYITSFLLICVWRRFIRIRHANVQGVHWGLHAEG